MRPVRRWRCGWWRRAPIRGGWASRLVEHPALFAVLDCASRANRCAPATRTRAPRSVDSVFTGGRVADARPECWSTEYQGTSPPGTSLAAAPGRRGRTPRASSGWKQHLLVHCSTFSCGNFNCGAGGHLGGATPFLASGPTDWMWRPLRLLGGLHWADPKHPHPGAPVPPPGRLPGEEEGTRPSGLPPVPTGGPGVFPHPVRRLRRGMTISLAAPASGGMPTRLRRHPGSCARHPLSLVEKLGDLICERCSGLERPYRGLHPRRFAVGFGRDGPSPVVGAWRRTSPCDVAGRGQTTAEMRKFRAGAGGVDRYPPRWKLLGEPGLQDSNRCLSC